MKNLNIPKESFKNNFQIMKQQEVYPYDYIDSFDKFNETKKIFTAY